MGHTEYLDDAYLRLEDVGEIAEKYREAMPNVSVYQIEDQELKEQTSAIEAENLVLKGRLARVENEIKQLRELIQKFLEE